MNRERWPFTAEMSNARKNVVVVVVVAILLLAAKYGVWQLLT
jgi:hypothetical protein